MTVDMVERMAKAMAEADLWPGAWDGNMPHGHAMSDAEKNAWCVRAESGLAAVAPLIAAAEREACAEFTDGLGKSIQAQSRNDPEKLIGRLFCEHATAIRNRTGDTKCA